MSHTTESHRPVHTRIGMVNVPAAVADRIDKLEEALILVKQGLRKDVTTVHVHTVMDRALAFVHPEGGKM